MFFSICSFCFICCSLRSFLGFRTSSIIDLYRGRLFFSDFGMAKITLSDALYHCNDHLLKYLTGVDMAKLSIVGTLYHKLTYSHDEMWGNELNMDRKDKRKTFYKLCHASNIMRNRMYPNMVMDCGQTVVHAALYNNYVYVVTECINVYKYCIESKRVTLVLQSGALRKPNALASTCDYFHATSHNEHLFIATSRGVVHINLSGDSGSWLSLSSWIPVKLESTGDNRICMLLADGRFAYLRYTDIASANERLQARAWSTGWPATHLAYTHDNHCLLAQEDGMLCRVNLSTSDQTVTRYQNCDSVECMKAVASTHETVVLFTNFDVCIVKDSMTVRHVSTIPFVQQRSVTISVYMDRVMFFPYYQQYYVDCGKKSRAYSECTLQQHSRIVSSCNFASENLCIIGSNHGEVYMIQL